MQRIKEEFNKEKEKRELFEDNVINLLDETCSKVIYQNEN